MRRRSILLASIPLLLIAPSLMVAQAQTIPSGGRTARTLPTTLTQAEALWPGVAYQQAGTFSGPGTYIIRVGNYFTLEKVSISQGRVTQDTSSTASPNVVAPCPGCGGCGATFTESAQATIYVPPNGYAGIYKATAQIDVCYWAKSDGPLQLTCDGLFTQCSTTSGPGWTGSGSTTATAYWGFITYEDGARSLSYYCSIGFPASGASPSPYCEGT